MQDYINDRLKPEIEGLKKQVRELQMRFNQPPVIELEIRAVDTDELIRDLQKLYQNFAAGCNLKIKVKMDVAGDTRGTTG